MCFNVCDRFECYHADLLFKDFNQINFRTDADTWVFPLVEMGQLGLHHDSLVTKKLLSASLKHSMLRLASGYFNLTDTYMHTLTHDCPASCSILMAHPNVSENSEFIRGNRLYKSTYFLKG